MSASAMSQSVLQDIILKGIAPVPLAGYLKALGVLRLLAEQQDPAICGYWQHDHFVLRTTLTKSKIESFFLDQYAPTPIMAPWNGGSGFYAKDNKKALQAISDSKTPRFEVYRDCLQAAEQVLQDIKAERKTSPKDDDKSRLLKQLRGQLPDAALDWFDAAVLLAGDDPKYPPLLGSGGNDGRLDFTNNFMQRLVDDVLGTDQLPGTSRSWLKASLFDAITPGFKKANIGQFSPGQAGGANASNSFDADSLINPWDFVLMMEGALAFAAAAVRRYADDPDGVLAYPFTVRAVATGSGSLGENEKSRGELWLPLWDQAATYAEIRSLMTEGRVALDKKPAKDALDFVRAVQRLGAYRGVSHFQRYGLLERNGMAYFATPLARVVVSTKSPARLVDDLDKNDWLDRFRRYTTGDTVAARFVTCRRQLEHALFAFSGRDPDQAEAQQLLILLGQIQTALADSPSMRMDKNKNLKIKPVSMLSKKWVSAADDDSSAFRIAKALAGLCGSKCEDDGKKLALPLRAQLFPVDPTKPIWMEQALADKHDPYLGIRLCLSSGIKGRLIDTLCDLLTRRLWLSEKLSMADTPLDSYAGVDADDMVAFLHGDDAMDQRIAELLPGLALCHIPKQEKQSGSCGEAQDDGSTSTQDDRQKQDAPLPAAFALLKASLTPSQVLQHISLSKRGQKVLPEGANLKRLTHLPVRLMAGNQNNSAIEAAWRCLRNAGVPMLFPIDALPTLGNIDPKRAGAALLIPLRFDATARMLRRITTQAEQQPEQT